MIVKSLLWIVGILALLMLINLLILFFTDVTSTHYSENYPSDSAVEYEIPTPFGIYFLGTHIEMSSSCSICMDIIYEQKPFSGFLLGGLGFYELVELRAVE